MHASLPAPAAARSLPWLASLGLVLVLHLGLAALLASGVLSAGRPAFVEPEAAVHLLLEAPVPQPEWPGFLGSSREETPTQPCALTTAATAHYEPSAAVWTAPRYSPGAAHAMPGPSRSQQVLPLDGAGLFRSGGSPGSGGFGTSRGWGGGSEPGDGPLDAGPPGSGWGGAGAGGSGTGRGLGDGTGSGSGGYGYGTGGPGGGGTGMGAGTARRPALALSGRPVYPEACRRGQCTGHSPCEGTGLYRVTCERAGERPVAVKCVRSAGCSILDGSAARFLEDSRIPVAGTFDVSIRFMITDL